MNAHELAAWLLSVPDAEVIIHTSCCGCSAPKDGGAPLRVVDDVVVVITDEAERKPAPTVEDAVRRPW
ncbi:MAG TPA: hypothetical protein VIQ30_02080 [Pseudonocardia sp.]